METKSHQKFRQRIEHAELYLQTVYCALQFTSRGLKRRGRNNNTLNINNCTNLSMNRLNQPLTEINRIFNYSKTNICKYYIVELYKAFDEYLRNSIKEIFLTSPTTVLGLSDKQINMTGADIVAYGNYQNVCNKIIADIYRELENMQSTKKLLDKYIKVFKLNIPNVLIDDALSLLELRHLIIHNNSIIDLKYQTSFPASGLTNGSKVPTNYTFANSQQIKLVSLINYIDQESIRLGLMNQIP